MTVTQEYLLVLLKEVDEICKKYNITYYLAGGTLVGAVRHGEFLPWDDDADIHMFREDAERFIEAVKAENKEDRLVYTESEKGQYGQVHWRYQNVGTTSLLRSLVATDAAQGQFVDIFVLYPVPKDEEAKNELLKNYELYLELRAQNVTVSSRHRDQNYLKDYYSYKAKEKKIGKQKVLRELEEKIFYYPDELADEWLIRSPNPSKRTTPKEWWGTPRYVKFEDTELPVAEYAEVLMCDQYGPTWFEIPQHVERGSHTFASDFEIPYSVYTAEYKKHINEEEFYNWSVRKKDFWFKLLWDRNVVRPQLWEMKGLQLSLELQQAVEDYNFDLKQMVKDQRFDEIAMIFQTYFDFYTKDGVKFWNLYVDIPDEYLYAAVYKFCFDGNYSRAKKLLKKRILIDREISEDIMELDAICDATDDLLINMYTLKDYVRSREIIDEWLDKYPNLLYFLRAKMFLDINDKVADNETLLAQCNTYLEMYPNDGELLKSRGDILIDMGLIKDGELCYKKALDKLRNGFYVFDIKNYFRDK